MRSEKFFGKFSSRVKLKYSQRAQGLLEGLEITEDTDNYAGF